MGPAAPTPTAPTTTTGLPTAGLGRAWGPFVLIPGLGGAPYKAESRRDGVEPGSLERFTVWIADDPRPEPHDHPWPFVSTILTGGYSERRFRRGADGAWAPLGVFVWRAGQTLAVPAGDAHVVFDVLPGTTTHMLMGPLTAGPRDWGHLLPGADGALAWTPAAASPEFLAQLGALNTRPA